MYDFIQEFRKEYFLENSLNPAICQNMNHIALEVLSVLILKRSTYIQHLVLLLKMINMAKKLLQQMLKILYNVGLSSRKRFFCRFRKGNT
jgi:quinolinate synthase